MTNESAIVGGKCRSMGCRCAAFTKPGLPVSGLCTCSHDRAMHQSVTTTDGKPPRPLHEYGQAGAPAPVRADGQHESYWVLSADERAKGYVRPLRHSYRHVGEQPKFPLRDLTDEERTRHAGCNYVKFEVYPESESPKTGRFWTEAALKGGCGTETRMGFALCETYARDPSFYGSTFCAGCRTHFPVAEFRWVEDDQVVGS